MYDVTIGYPYKIIESEVDLLKTGDFPRAVHVDIKKYDIHTLPTDDEDVASWLSNVWKQKEDKLQYFYSKPAEKRFFEPSGERIIWPVCFFFFFLKLFLLNSHVIENS